MNWIQEADALVGRSGEAMFKIFNKVNYRGPAMTAVEQRSRGELSVTLIAPGHHYIIGKVDTEEEGQRFSEWVARAMNYE